MAYIYLLKRLWEYADNDRYKIIFYFICHIISLLGVLLQPFTFAMVINALQKNDSNLLKEVIFWLGIYVCLFAIFNVFHRLGRFVEQRVAFRIRQRFVNSTYNKILGLPMHWHTEHHSGNTINRVKVASDAIYTFGELQFQYIENFMMFWGPLVALCVLSYQISIIAFVISIVTIWIIGKFDNVLVPLFAAENETQHSFMAVFFDYIGNIKTIITLRLAGKTQEELNAKIEHAYPILTKSISVNQAKWAVVSCCILTLEIGIIFYYIFVTTAQSTTPIMIGFVVAIFQYLQQLSKMFFSIAANYQDIVHMCTNFKSVQPILDEHEKERNSKIEHIKLPEWQKMDIKHLDFSYQNQNGALLTNLSISMRNQSKIALVGESGSGKSTLLSLLRGLYAADTVKLQVDDKQFKSLLPLSEITTLILQDPEIFENTIEFNVTVGTNVNSDYLQRMLDISRFQGVLDKLPNGMQTDIRERGVNLSGGEKQRLALARGLVAAKDSSILLLDEPTSSIDVHNELMIYDGIFSEYSNKCIISSVHRLHLLDRFDMVYVMEKGQIVQQGTLSELRNKDGLFAELWKKYSKEHEQESAGT